MRRLFALAMILGVTWPCLGAKKVTVQQLEQIVSSLKDRTDQDAAGQLALLELRERLSAARARALSLAVPGPVTRGSLLVLGDASVFLNLPAQDIATIAAPDTATQRQMLNLVQQYVGQTLAQLPNFFATRETILFMDNPPRPGQASVPADDELQLAAKSQATVLYRDGKQIVEPSAASEGKRAEPESSGLVTSGEFGPMLGTVLADARQSELAWSHWEKLEDGEEAVFRYAVPKKKSHYEAKFCCVKTRAGRGLFQQLAGYHGEIAIDAGTGAILRMTMQADLKPAYPMARADLMVEYDLVEIGGRSYLCPAKSVAIASGYESVASGGVKDSEGQFNSLVAASAAHEPNKDAETLQTMLNDVVFRDYHLFRADSRIVLP
jgi:hypothetical protein